MSAIAADLLVPGFDDPVHDAQRVFRRVLEAFSYPGRIIDLARGPDGPAFSGLDGLPDAVPRGLAAVLLALTDADAPVHLVSPHVFDTPALAALLRFHAGAPIVDRPGGAAFAAVLDPAHALPLDRFDRGTPDYPDRSTTVLLALPALDGGPAVQLRGPGIADAAQIAPQGLANAFWRERAALQAEFPLGIDLILCAGTRLLGLPRTTQARWEER